MDPEERRHKRRAEEDEDDRRHNKKSKKERHERKSKREKERRSEHKAVKVVDDDPDMDDMWVEKEINIGGENPITTDIPTSASLDLKSSASQPHSADLPSPVRSETKLVRDEWMTLPSSRPVVPHPSPPVTHASQHNSFTEGYGEAEGNGRTLGGEVDFFSNLGTERKRKQPKDRKDPEKEPTISSRELNKQLVEGKTLDQYVEPPSTKKNVPGGPGSQWRMAKLRRVYEAAEEEGKSVEAVALERYGSQEAFGEALEERRILDERADRARPQKPTRENERKTGGLETRYSFSDTSRPASRNSFRRPGESGSSTPYTSANPLPKSNPPANRRLDSLRLTSNAISPSPKQKASTQGTPLAMTPIPSVMTPNLRPSGPPPDLNKLQAKVLKAKLMGSSDAAELEKEYEEAKRRSEGAFIDEGDTKLEVLPTLDGQGRLYDVGTGTPDQGPVRVPGNRRQKEKPIETRDTKTGELLRVNADDDDVTLGEMLRQERFGAGIADQKNLDRQLARAIATDGKFEDDLEYMDDNAEKLGRKKMRTDAMKRQFAIHDYAKTRKVLASCVHCYGEDDSPPKAGVVAMGTRCYLACTTQQELVPGHCQIVPIQHHLCMLEGDEELWDEVRNFMKCLIRMFNEEGKGVVFYETVLNFRWQKHTYIECMPVPYDLFEMLPGYFKESILMSEMEWSQHKKLIDFSTRPGGFRRSMVPNLPYFMIQFDYKGEKGYGHVIEGVGDAAGGGDPDGAVDEGEKGGGEFPRWFAAEIIGNLLELEPRLWRKPRWMDRGQNKARVESFRKKYEPFDWTPLLRESR